MHLFDISPHSLPVHHHRLTTLNHTDLCSSGASGTELDIGNNKAGPDILERSEKMSEGWIIKIKLN